MQSSSVVVVLGTGGTIAGTAADAGDDIGYVAAQLGVAQLLQAVPALGSVPIEAVQIAQVDSKDMTFALWLEIARQVGHHAARPDVRGIVVTHGTDTLEETAYFLQRVLAPAKPVVLVGAMRPASSARADGPRNLLDAVAVAQADGARGVVVVLDGTVHGALDVRKRHTARVDAFESGDAGPLGHVVHGGLVMRRAWPAGDAIGLACLPADPASWPAVEIVTSLAGTTGLAARALVAAGVRGIVVAGTGNGSVHQALEAALDEAEGAGVAVLRSSRWLDGSVQDATAPRFRSAGTLTPAQARVELMLTLMAAATR